VELAALCFFAFLAGFVDSVAGGGGLIQLPALLIALPAETHGMAVVAGTNKFSSLCGTSVAVAQYSRRVAPSWNILVPAGLTAMVFAWLGALVVKHLKRETLEPVFLALMIAVAIYTYWKKDFGNLHAPRLTPRASLIAALLTGSVIGFYDGFFGPGTGSFLIFIFIGVFGFDFLRASASAKIINLATNFGSVTLFATHHQILYHYAVPMGLSNIAGSFIGSRLAILKGNQFVRLFFLLVVSAMILRFAWKLFGS
jgi:uncharacterized protein